MASHSAFDRIAVSRALERYGLGQLECQWLDTARVVRRCWQECAQRNYGLESVAGMLGIEFAAHNALEDARAAGEILARAMAKNGMTEADWLERVRLPIDPSRPD